MKKISVDTTRSLKTKLTKEADRTASRKQDVAKRILEDSLADPAYYEESLQKVWDNGPTSTLTIPIGEDKKKALKARAKRRQVPLKSWVLHVLRRYFEGKAKSN